MNGLRQLLAAVALSVAALSAPAQIENPILPGFNPDPTICRVGSDYYICTSSFTWYPGLPIYHSRDLRHWEKVANAIDRPGMVTLDGVKDKDGVWAPTLRHHDGTWYLFCNVSNGGNFYITAKDVRGPWSDPVFIKGAPGIDPDIFWDDDGRSYLLANSGQFPGRKYPASTSIWIQEIDLATGRLTGERKYIATGHAFNAKYAEGAHLYKIDGKYVLTVAEGGTDFNHAVTLFTSRNLMGPYIPQQVNPVLSHRQFGRDYPLQCVGHADMVQTEAGEWYAVALGKRMVDGRHAFTRETFICPVAIQDGEFIFNPGRGGMTAFFTWGSGSERTFQPSELCRRPTAAHPATREHRQPCMPRHADAPRALALLHGRDADELQAPPRRRPRRTGAPPQQHGLRGTAPHGRRTGRGGERAGDQDSAI